MGSQRLLSMSARRTQLLDCIRLLEQRQHSYGARGVRRMIAALRQKTESLQRLIDSEEQCSGHNEVAEVAEASQTSDAA